MTPIPDDHPHKCPGCPYWASGSVVRRRGRNWHAGCWVTELENAAREVVRELLGAAHARIGICRGHCTDEEPHTVIDAELCSLDAQTYALAMRLRALLSDTEGGSE